MKIASFLGTLFLLLSIGIRSFTLIPAGESLYRISIKGVDHDFRQDGLKPSEFAELTINANDEKIEIEAFDITLARGNRAVSIHEVRGNTFDLNDFRAMARSGDRLVIEIKLRHKTGSSKSSNAVVAIRVM